MSPVNPIFALLVICLALGTAAVLSRYRVIQPATGHLSPLDGLRGLSAVGVFLHHSVIWFFYRSSGEWKIPPSKFYTLLGESSVSLFFMISAFLFISKLLDADVRPIDWTRLYASRVLRMAPLYWVAMAVLFAAVAVRSGFHLNQRPISVVREVLGWISFTIAGGPNINAVPGTAIMIAGVVWSLPYEWLFYATLPLLALILRRAVPLWIVGLAVVVCGLFYLSVPITPIRLAAFGGGAVAAILVRQKLWRQFATTKLAAGAALLCLIIGFSAFKTAYGIAPLVVLSGAFAIIAGGNSLFGLLTTPAARILGEISYSVYLLHGLALFGVMAWLMPRLVGHPLSALEHWGAVLAITPILITICTLTFRGIEAPAMGQVAPVTAWLKGLGRKRTAAA